MKLTQISSKKIKTIDDAFQARNSVINGLDVSYETRKDLLKGHGISRWSCGHTTNCRCREHEYKKPLNINHMCPDCCDKLGE